MQTPSYTYIYVYIVLVGLVQIEHCWVNCQTVKKLLVQLSLAVTLVESSSVLQLPAAPVQGEDKHSAIGGGKQQIMGK